MRKTLGWIAALGTILFVLMVSSYVLPEFVCMLLSGLVLLALVVLLGRCLVTGLFNWRRFNLWLMPTMACLALLLCSFYFASPIGRHISDRMFKRHLGDYFRLVNDFRKGTVNCESVCDGAAKVVHTTSLPAHVLDIWGAHCEGSGVIILFRIDTNVPLLHEGYMFKDYEETSDCSKESSRFYVRQIQGPWYRFSDQPGF